MMEYIDVLESLRAQIFPLNVTQNQGEAVYVAIRRIMEFVPESAKDLVQPDYDLVTSAFCHPSDPFNTNRPAQ